MPRATPIPTDMRKTSRARSTSYRDWVINALNRDLPYDQFIIEQLAGDQLPGATQDQVVATGLLRNSMINEEGGVDPEQFRMEAMFDRIDCIGKGILGLTIQCAQCHSHKFDPLTQEEYYRMFAFLNNAYEANVAVYTPAEQKERAELARKIHEIEELVQRQNPDWPDRMAAWERQVAAGQPDWIVVRPEVDDESTGGEKYLPMEDGSFLAQGYAPTKHTLEMTVKTGVAPITAFRLELLNDPNLPLGGPGRSIKGTAALTEFRVEAAPADGKGKPVSVKFSRATADINPPETPLEAIFDDHSKRQASDGPDRLRDRRQGRDRLGHRRRPGPAQPAAQGRVHGRKTDLVPGRHGPHVPPEPGPRRLEQRRQPEQQPRPVPALDHDRARRRRRPAPGRCPLHPGDPAATSAPPAQAAAVFSFWRTTVPEWKGVNVWIDTLARQHPEGSSQLALLERARPRSTHMLQRGDFLKPGKPVEPGVPSFLNPLPAGRAPTRLTFARWLAARDAPTTARSLVNRVWQAYFGTGIVATSEDLGSQCEAPSHPELLDWLAVEFMDNGWSLKHLHRLIVTSATYRQSSPATPELLARDPYNRLLARGPRFRVDAEIVRDIALSASGLLNARIGGPSVCPPAPAFLFQPPTSYGPKVWNEATGPDRFRRALYTFRYRSVPYPALEVFDAPNGDFACVRRSRSNTPLQALATLNEPIYLECARALAMRTLVEGGSTDSDRLVHAFRLCLARPPTEPETATLLDLLQLETRRFDRPGADPWSLAAGDPSKPPRLPSGVTPPQLAAWTAVARVLLNLDETITKE